MSAGIDGGLIMQPLLVYSRRMRTRTRQDSLWHDLRRHLPLCLPSAGVRLVVLARVTADVLLDRKVRSDWFCCITMVELAPEDSAVPKEPRGKRLIERFSHCWWLVHGR